MRCPSCNHENRDAAKFCAGCSSPLAQQCSRCGAPRRPDAKFCDECGAPAAPVPAPPRRAEPPKHLAEKILTGKAALEGERKQVTVLFADVKGSMELAEQLDPEEWSAIMQRFFKILSEGVERFEGFVDKFTDMVGFNALAQRNEALALELLAEHPRRLRPMFSQHGGREIKSTSASVSTSATRGSRRCSRRWGWASDALHIVRY